MGGWQRNKLKKLLFEADAEWVRKFAYGNAKKPVGYVEEIADYLLAHGVSVVPSKVREAEK